MEEFSPDLLSFVSRELDQDIMKVLGYHIEEKRWMTYFNLGAYKSNEDNQEEADQRLALYVDGVSSVASIDFRMDEWKVDLCVSGSQKGLMLPTGMGIVCASQKALEARKNSKLPKTFFDWEDQIKTNDLGYFPYTPPMNLLRGLRKSIDLLLEEGLDNVFARHNRMATAVRKAVEAWGMRPIAKEPKWYSDTVTAVATPEGYDGNEVVRHAYKYYNIAFL